MPFDVLLAIALGKFFQIASQIAKMYNRSVDFDQLSKPVSLEQLVMKPIVPYLSW